MPVSQSKGRSTQASQYGHPNSPLVISTDLGDDTAIPDPYDTDTENDFEPPLFTKDEPGYNAWGRERPVKDSGPKQDPRPPPRKVSGVVRPSSQSIQDACMATGPVATGSHTRRGECSLCRGRNCSCAIRGDRKDPTTGIGIPPQGSAAMAPGHNLIKRTHDLSYDRNDYGYLHIKSKTDIC